MDASFTISESFKTIFAGIAYFSKPKILLLFILTTASLFLITYFGVYLTLNIIIQSPLTANYTVYYPSYVIPAALCLVLLEFFLFFYFLSVTLELKKRIEFNLRSNTLDAFSVGLKKYPKFLIATIVQFFLLAGGLVLLVIPGVYLGVKSIFFNIESHNGDAKLSSGLNDSFALTKGYSLKILPVFLFYLLLFFGLIYWTLNSGLDLIWIYLIISIIVTFCTIAYTFSADNLYHLIKRVTQGGNIKSQLFRRIIRIN